ncbi:tripartite tricarboxylate transporter substrate binding protein [Rhodovarius crocodyli]|uniref:Tripartite tricarboxylate transporter substrate binding protein n=1 Tax=Rhodovarius crocodyli TaxID=1979269 RepID=A0A437MIU8_9PROT|nr:tripartite tricarboxylate transporter substrate binding protein [Rhodovarius crocodyli]RVT97594.1 tripartite tricarboxylate transporter substrate binding protein [Rhodovarius crocodyli]
MGITLPRRGLFAAALAPLASPALAQPGFPTRPLRLVIAFGPGGAADLLGRVVAERMTTTLGQPVLVENRAGAGGNIGAQQVLQAEKDGHTILLHAQGLAANRFLFNNLPYDPDRDLTPVALIGEMPNMMVVSPSMRVNSVADFVALAKSRPGMTYGSIGNGTSMHLAGALFCKAAGIEMQHVPYRDTSAVNTDVMTGRVDTIFQTFSAASQLVQGGQMKALAVTGDARVAALPQVPTLKEAGVDLSTSGWWGLFVATGVPTDRIAKLEAETLAAVRDPAVAQRIAAAGGIPRPMDSATFRAFVQSETTRFRDVVGGTGMRAD